MDVLPFEIQTSTERADTAMNFDMYSTRKYLGYTQQYLADCAGVGRSYFSDYERRGVIPSKYLYKLWKKLPDFPIPDDFFFFTSTTLKMNMVYHNISQIEVKDHFGLKSQATISGWLREPMPLYEYKDAFKTLFIPLIVPFELKEENNGKKRFMYLTDLGEKGCIPQTEKI